MNDDGPHFRRVGKKYLGSASFGVEVRTRAFTFLLVQ